MKAEEAKISSWQQMLASYETLEQTLAPLPHELSRPVMVPYGSLAFFPGRIIHPNELTVSLGENWFADQTVSQTLGIISRRKYSIRESIKRTEEEVGKLRKQLDIIGNLLQGGAGEVVEIVEQYDDQANLISSNLPQYPSSAAGNQPHPEGKGTGKSAGGKATSAGGKPGKPGAGEGGKAGAGPPKAQASPKAKAKREDLIDFDLLLAKLEDLEKQESEEESGARPAASSASSSQKRDPPAREGGSSQVAPPSEKEPLRSTSQPIPIPAPTSSAKKAHQQTQQPKSPQLSSSLTLREDQKQVDSEIRTPADLYEHMLRLSQGQPQNPAAVGEDEEKSPTKQVSSGPEALAFTGHVREAVSGAAPGSPRSQEEAHLKRQVSFKEDSRGEVATNVRLFKAGSTIGVKKGRLSSEDGEPFSPTSILKPASPSINGSPLQNPLESRAASQPAPSQVVSQSAPQSAPQASAAPQAGPTTAKAPPPQSAPQAGSSKKKDRGSPIMTPGAVQASVETPQQQRPSPAPPSLPTHDPKGAQVPEFDDSGVDDSNIVDMDQVAKEYHAKRSRFFSPAQVPADETPAVSQAGDAPKKVSRFKASRMQAQRQEN